MYLTLQVVMADKYKGLAFCTTICEGYQSQLNWYYAQGTPIQTSNISRINLQ